MFSTWTVEAIVKFVVGIVRYEEVFEFVYWGWEMVKGSICSDAGMFALVGCSYGNSDQGW